MGGELDHGAIRLSLPVPVIHLGVTESRTLWVSPGAAHSPASRWPSTKASRANFHPQEPWRDSKMAYMTRQGSKDTNSQSEPLYRTTDLTSANEWRSELFRIEKKKDEKRMKKHSNQVSYTGLFEKTAYRRDSWEAMGKFAVDYA